VHYVIRQLVALLKTINNSDKKKEVKRRSYNSTLVEPSC